MPNQLDCLIEKIGQLRDKNKGCPWMLQQTLESIVPHTLEEAYEVADAVENNNMPELKNELGDLLYSVLIYADIANEKGFFNIQDVIEGLNEKITRRHPHLFDPNQLQSNLSLEHLEKNWVEIKNQESNYKKNTIPMNLPALSYAQKIQKQVAIQGFDWKESEGIIQKLQEEIREYQEAKLLKNPEAIQEELGDLLFTVVNLIRFSGFDSEQTLRLANRKFSKRVQLLEEHLCAQGKNLNDCSTDELERIWQIIKSQ